MKRMGSQSSAIAAVVSMTIAACGTQSGDAGGRRPSWNPNTPPKTADGNTGMPSTDAPILADNPGGPPVRAPMVEMTGAAGSGLREGQCAKQDINFTRVVPTVWLVLDGSGSMVNAFGDITRWEAMRGALMDPAGGVVKLLEKDVKFGMIMYDGPGGSGMAMLPDGGSVTFSAGPAETCPRLVAVEPMKMAFDAINMAFPLEPLGGSTPTDKALFSVIDHLPVAGTIPPDEVVGPTIVVLATDGEPNDFCTESWTPIDVKPAVVQAVGDLAAAGNKTYVVSLAAGDAALNEHLLDVAAAGNTGFEPFIPSSKDELVQVFRNIIGAEAQCDVTLSGKVKVGSECKGKLQINGVDLPCNDPNGWHLKDASTISITGTGCETYKMMTSANLHADFPCDIIDLN
jgi:hypothetical protein